MVYDKVYIGNPCFYFNTWYQQLNDIMSHKLPFICFVCRFESEQIVRIMIPLSNIRNMLITLCVCGFFFSICRCYDNHEQIIYLSFKQCKECISIQRLSWIIHLFFFKQKICFKRILSCLHIVDLRHCVSVLSFNCIYIFL